MAVPMRAAHFGTDHAMRCIPQLIYMCRFNRFGINDLNYTGSYLAFRLEGDKKSIDERLKDLNDELELKKFKTSILDVYQSSLFWKKVNNLEIFSNTKNISGSSE